MEVTTSISNDKYLICEHLGTLIAAKISSDGHRIEAETFSLEGGRLSREKGGETIKTRPVVFWIEGIAFADDVLFCDLGIYLPTFLVIINTREASRKICFAIFVLVNGELKLLKSIFCPAGVDFSNPNVTPVLDVCEGPTVLLVDVETVSVYVCYADDDAFREIYMDALYSNLVDETTDCDSVAFRSVAPYSQGICTFVASFYIVKKEDESDIQVEHRGFAVLEDGSLIIKKDNEINDYFQEIFSFVPPEEYWTIVCVSEVINLAPCDYELWPRLSKDMTKCLAFATEMEQFLVSFGHKILLCCEIPFKDCCSIKKFKLPGKGTAFLLISKSFQCCVVSADQNKVLQHWTGVHHALIGDFNRVGHDQLLVLFSAVINPQDIRFLLTDFLCCQEKSSTSAEDATENIQVTKSLAAVAKALSTSSQATMLETSQAKTTYDAKNELIRETWENMEKMTINEQEEESARSSDLVPLFEEEERKSIVGNKSSSSFQRPFQLLDTHQEVMWDKWIVTVKVKINTTRQIKNAFLNMLVEDQVCHSPVVTMQSKQKNTTEEPYDGVITDDILGESSRKKSKGDTVSQRQQQFMRDQEIILTATTDLPSFSHQRIVEANLMVTWEEFEDSRTDLSRYSCYVGTVELDVEKVVSGIYAPKNLQSIARDFESIEMLVTSKHSTLSSLPDRLKDPLQKINCGLSGATEDASVTELAETSSGHVFLCLSSSQVSAEIKIYARSQSQVTLICHVISSILPQDFQISLPLPKLNELVNNVNRCLSRELSLLETILEGNDGSKNVEEGRRTVSGDDFVMEVEELPAKEKSSSRAALHQARVDKIRSDFQRKRKRTEFFINEAKISTVDPHMYKQYLAAIRESNQAAELLYLVRVEET